MTKIQNIITLLIYSPWTIFFNFYFLPFKQACKFPIFCYSRIKMLRWGGQVRIESEIVKMGMIHLGKVKSPLYEKKCVRWNVNGMVVFHGKVTFSDNTSFNCEKNAVIEIGKDSTFNFDTHFICANKIQLGDKTRCSWSVTFIDNDFHPLIDLATGKTLKQSFPIKSGYGVWIGHNCIVSKGARIGDNITVSSGSVVKGIYKRQYSVIGGNIAKVIAEGFKRDDT